MVRRAFLYVQQSAEILWVKRVCLILAPGSLLLASACTPALGFEQLDGFELILDYFFALHPKPLIEDDGIDAAEVGVVLEIAIIESIKTGMIADKAWLHFATDKEDGCRRSMVGAHAAIFFDPSPKLGEGEDEHSLFLAAGFEVLVESCQS